jgi:hypothetical protein
LFFSARIFISSIKRGGLIDEINIRRNKNMNLYNSWAGYGIKTGGTLAIVGVEGIAGQLFNLGDRSSGSFNMLSMRIGAGLGAGTGLCAVFAFNTPNLWSLNGKKTKDLSLNFSIGGKWCDFFKFLTKTKYADLLVETTKQLSKTKQLNLKQAENARNIGSALYTNYDLHTASGSSMIAIDIPGAGIGLELSAHYLEGTMEIGK